MKKKEPPSKLRTLAPTMTCAGGTENVHPDGRSFTICESQLLQGFPLHHRFAKELKRTNILAQIGNAFPPLFVKKLLRHIRRQLQNTDGVPESIDADEFMSSKEIREQEVAQFFKDHEDLPEGTRANIVYTEGAYQEDDDEEESETAGFILVNDPMETSWSWITSDSNTRRSSSDSSPSNSSQNSSATFVANPRIMPESIRNMNDTLADSPNDTISQVTRSWYSWTSQSAQVSKQSGSELHEVHSSTTLDLKRQRLGQEVECVEIKKPMNLMDSSLKICGSSNDNPIEL